MTEQENTDGLYVGDWHIFWTGTCLWIENTKDGEGGSFNPAMFAEVVRKFYQEEF